MKYHKCRSLHWACYLCRSNRTVWIGSKGSLQELLLMALLTNNLEYPVLVWSGHVIHAEIDLEDISLLFLDLDFQQLYL